MRFLVSGYYGFGNLGDEALLAQLVTQLKTRYPLATIDVLSQHPAETAHQYGVAATPRMDLVAVRKAIERSDVVLSGAGGLLQTATSFKSLLYYAGVVRTGVRAGKRTMIFAQSIGPLDFWGKQTVKECCRGIAAATVRDERSRALLASILPGVEIERTADLVFLYDPPDEPVDLARLPADGRPMRAIRGGQISIIFQEPMSSLSPLHTIGDQVGEALRLHRDGNYYPTRRDYCY